MADLRTDHLRAVIDTAVSTTEFSVVDVQGLVLVAIELPDTFAGTALTFEGDSDGDDTYQAIYDSDGNEVSWTVANSRLVVPAADQPLIAGLVSLKVVSGSAEADETTLILHFVRTNR